MPLSTFEGTDLVYSGTITSVERIEETQAMYNLTVDTAHTFFVGEGQWLVHNTNYGCGNLSLQDVASRIANGHSLGKHDQSSFHRLGISNAEELQQAILDGISNAKDSPLGDKVKPLRNGRTGFYDPHTGNIIVIDPKHKDLGTVFRPDSPWKYFNERLR